MVFNTVGELSRRTRALGGLLNDHHSHFNTSILIRKWVTRNCYMLTSTRNCCMHKVKYLCQLTHSFLPLPLPACDWWWWWLWRVVTVTEVLVLEQKCSPRKTHDEDSLTHQGESTSQCQPPVLWVWAFQKHRGHTAPLHSTPPSASICLTLFLM